ncbi:21486_t:CDS:2, partial [Dentiscutata erythropus]
MVHTTEVTTMKAKKQTGKKVTKIVSTSHWKYISSYHGPWLQLPLELLESLYMINNDNVATPPPPIDPIIFGNLISIRRLVDEAADLSVRAASGVSTTGGGPTRSSMSHTRQHRMRELAVNKLALAYRIDEIATAVVTMQSASAIDEVASRVLKKNSTNLEALYVNFFHEKIPSSNIDKKNGLVRRISQKFGTNLILCTTFYPPYTSRMLSQSTSTDILDKIIATSPTTPEFYRTRGVVKCFKEEFAGALRDFKTALAHTKHRKRVNNVLLGKKPTLPLHNHHGNEDDECTGTESQLYFLRAACYLQYAISLVDKAIQKVDGVERKDGEGSELRLVAVKKGNNNGTNNQGTTPKLEEYRKELLPIMHQVQSLTRRSVRDYTHFLGFYPSSLPPFSTSVEGTSKASTPIASRDSSPVRSFKDKDDNLSPPINPTDQQSDPKTTDKNRKLAEKAVGLSSDVENSISNTPASVSKDHNHSHHHSHHFHGYQPPHTFATYHPLLIEAWYAIALNYVLIGDLHTGALWHARIAEMHECIEGYPVFLPARSMAQADYMEVLERVKKANSLAQHEKLRELMLLASAEDDKDMIEGKKVAVKIGKKSKNATHNKNGNSVTPVIGIDGQRHHPCCPLAPGNHPSSPKENNYNQNHASSVSSAATSNSNSSVGNSNGNSNGTTSNNNAGGSVGGPRQYPLHTQRADS